MILLLESDAEWSDHLKVEPLTAWELVKYLGVLSCFLLVFAGYWFVLFIALWPGCLAFIPMTVLLGYKLFTGIREAREESRIESDPQALAQYQADKDAQVREADDGYWPFASPEVLAEARRIPRLLTGTTARQ